MENSNSNLRFYNFKSARADAILTLNDSCPVWALRDVTLIVYNDGERYDWYCPSNDEDYNDCIRFCEERGYHIHTEDGDLSFYDFDWEKTLRKDARLLVKIPTDDKYCGDGENYEWILYRYGKYRADGVTCKCGCGCGGGTCIRDRPDGDHDVAIEIARAN